MAEALSKSAKKRAAKQARDAAFTAETAAAPEPAPKAEPKAKAETKPKAEAKAKAEAKPKAEPKPAAQPKADAKAKAKKKPAAEAAPAPQPKAVQDSNYAVEIDDGSGAAWETCSGVSKKNERRQKKKEDEERQTKEQEIADAKAAKAGAKAAAAGGAGAAAAKATPTGRLSATQAAIEKANALANAPLTVQQPAAKPDAPAAEEEKKNLATAAITVPENKIGRVIGPKGKNLALIQEKTGVTRIDTDQGQFTVVGEDPQAVAAAELAIREMVEKGYMTLAYDDFQQVEVMAHPSTFPDLIGKGGEVIRKLKEKLDVEVNIPAVPKGTGGSKKYPVGVAGAKANVEKAKECLESIINYYHHEITHEGKEHVEMEGIPGWAYSFIIGKQGSELKHIQNNWDVKVYIPRENSANQNVVIVGSKVDCDRSKQYIEKLVSDAESRGIDKRQDKPDDHWGGEEPEEPWMKQYMVPKRS